MITYNPAFDLYHCIYRMAHILQRLDEGDIIEVDKIRIWDFYLLYPAKVYQISMKLDEHDQREWRKTFIRHENNPYDYSGNSRKLFEIISPYQQTALHCLISCGILDKEHFERRQICVSDRQSLQHLVNETGSLSDTESNVLSFLSLFSKHMSLLGEDGLKSRTHLMESKYDA